MVKQQHLNSQMLACLSDIFCPGQVTDSKEEKYRRLSSLNKEPKQSLFGID